MHAIPHRKLNIINAVLCVVLLFTSLVLLRNIVSSSLNEGAAVMTAVSERKDTGRTGSMSTIMRYAPIVEKNPFGPPSKFKQLSYSAAESTQKRSLDGLTLHGTVSGHEDLSYAIFLDTSQKKPFGQEIFSHGDDVFDYGQLTRIEKEYVEITRGGEKYTIEIIDISQVPSQTRTGTASLSRNDRLAKQINEKEFILDQGKVQSALNNPEQILSDARLYPNILNGKHEGFRILEVKRGGLYENLGLKNRDILLKVNGLDLTSPAAAMQAMTALKGMNNVNLDIIRSGQKMTLTYQIR